MVVVVVRGGAVAGVAPKICFLTDLERGSVFNFWDPHL